MNNNICVLSVQTSPEPSSYPPRLFTDARDLEEALEKKGVHIKLAALLKGGVASQVYRGLLDDTNVVVKHTDNILPFDPTEFFIDKNGHNIDTRILKLLNKSSYIKTPLVIKHFPDITTTIMEDMTDKGYRLLNDVILGKQLPMNSAKKIGKALAHLAIESRGWKPFATNESAEQSVYERGLELRLAYANTQTEYRTLEQEFTRNNKYWVWPDGHPKNMLVGNDGNVVFIDFGRSHWGDQRYMLPNFLAHIVMYGMAGYIPLSSVRQYIIDCIQTYKTVGQVDEPIFCKYLGMEILHRSYGKWVQGIDTKEQKLVLIKFGLEIFDGRIESVNNLLKLIA